MVDMGHIMELGHGASSGRWPYAMAYEKMLNANLNSTGQFLALTWGESLFFAAEK
jgi:hypothetical protein